MAGIVLHWPGLLALLLAGEAVLCAQISVLPSDPLAALTLSAPDTSYATRSVVSVTGQPFTQALQVATLRRTTNPWEVQLSAKTVVPVVHDDVLLATFSIRRVTPNPGGAFTAFIFEKAAANWDKSAERTLVEDEGVWHEFHVAFKAVADYVAGAAQVNFRLGYDPQIIQLGGISVTNYQKSVALESLPNDFTYAGRETNAAWRAPAAQRIEQYRKADLTIEVQDEYGVALPGAMVQARMVRHAFGLGSAVVADRLLGTVGTGADNARYQNIVTQWFNKVVLENDLKWPNWEANRSRAISAVNWLRARGLAVRGHNLIWPSWGYMPADVQTLTNNLAALRTRINNHITEEVTALRGKIVEWDVVNEPYSARDVLNLLGNGEMTNWFNLAQAADPAARLYLNDYGALEVVSSNDAHFASYLNTTRYLLSSGAPLEGIGLQCHFSSFLTGPQELTNRLDRFAGFGLPLEATEFDINATDQGAQADYTRDFMTALFSHPAVNGILIWGFWAGAIWKPDVALFQTNWTLRPNGVTWSNLVFHEWWTDTAGTTDDNGHFTLRGFKGDYQLNASIGGLTAHAVTSLLTNQSVMLVVTGVPPRLSITQTGGDVRIAWPAATANYSLQSVDDVAGATWAPVPEPPSVDGSWNTVTNASSLPQRFYRLRSR